MHLKENILQRNHSFIDFFGEEADSTLFINEIAGTASHRYDHEMLSVMKDAISRNSACMYSQGGSL